MSKKGKKGVDGRHLLNLQYRDLEADTGQDRLPSSSRPRHRYYSHQPSSFKQSMYVIDESSAVANRQKLTIMLNFAALD